MLNYSKQDAYAMYKSVVNKAKQMALNLTPLELKVEDATSNEPWGPHGTAMSDISRAAYDYDNYKQIMGVIARRLQSEGENWRHVYKSLLLLEYMAKHGPQKVVDELSSNVSVIERLHSFEFKDKNSKDWGLNVRQRAKELSTLVSDPERIRRERQKAKQNETKYTGVSAEDARSGFGSSSSSFAGGSNFGSGETYGGGSGYSSTFGGGGSSTLGGSALGGRSSGGGLGGFGSSSARYDDDFDDHHLTDDKHSTDEEDAREATRKRIESLRQKLPENKEGATAKSSPLKSGKSPEPSPEAKGRKRLSQVKVNPNIAMSLGTVPAPSRQPAAAVASTPAPTAAPVMDLLHVGDAGSAPAAQQAGSWDAFAEPQGGLANGSSSAVQDDWSSLVAGSGGAAPASDDPFAELAEGSSSAFASAAPPIATATSSDPFSGADPFGELAGVPAKTSSGPLAPAPPRPPSDPFASLGGGDPFAAPAAPLRTPVKAAAPPQAAQDSHAKDPFAASFLPVGSSPTKTAAGVSPSARVGQALPESMFSPPVQLGSQGSGFGTLASSPQGAGLLGGSPTRPATQHQFSAFGGSASSQAPLIGGPAPPAYGQGPAASDDLFSAFPASAPTAQYSSPQNAFGNMVQPQMPSAVAEALGGGLKMAPNAPQPNMPPPPNKKDPFAGLAGF